MESYGGLGLCVLQMVKGLRSNGIAVDILTREEDGIDEEILPAVTRAPFINLSGSRDWKLTHGVTLIPRLIYMMCKNDYDIIHVHNPPAGMCAIPIAALFGKKTVMTMHGPWAKVRDRLRSVAEAIEGFCLHVADHVTFDSVSLMETYGENDKFVAIQNAVDTDVFRPLSRTACREHLGIMSFLPIYLYSGRNVHGKDIDVIYKVAKRCTGAEFIITGMDHDGSDGACPNVIFKKSIPNDEMPVLYNACNGVILPTKAEGMSRALLEAMACGIAVLASDIPANHETVDAAGRYFRTDEDLCDLVNGLSYKDLGEFGDIGRDIASKKFSIRRRIDKVIGLYDRICKGGR